MSEIDLTKLVRCRACEGGTWWAACCNGADGCDCHGELVNMGPCNVCGGAGWCAKDADERANLRTIQGRCFIGRGPTHGYWAGK